MSEREDAIKLANHVLDRPYADPDDDVAILARQFLRAIEIGPRILPPEGQKDSVRLLRKALLAVMPQVHPCGSKMCEVDGHKECPFGQARAALVTTEEPKDSERRRDQRRIKLYGHPLDRQPTNDMSVQNVRLREAERRKSVRGPGE